MPQDRTDGEDLWPGESGQGEPAEAPSPGPGGLPFGVPGQPPPSYGAPGQPGYTQPLAGFYGQYPGGYGQPDPYPPPPDRGARRIRSLIAYLTVAVVAAAAGAGVTGYLVGRGPALGPGSQGQGPPGGISGGLHEGGTAGGRVSAATVRAVARAVRPGLVDISSNLGYQGSQAAATGMIISGSGLVLTNNHVIADTTRLYVTIVTTHRQFRARWLGYDAVDDIAVIKLIGAHNLPTVPIGNSASVRLGDGVIALGNAEGAGGAPAAPGMITGLNRTITATDSGVGSRETLHGMFQTNARIVQGDSGGPLADTSGHVIGMTTAAATASIGGSTQSRGFAIPIDRALRIARQIISGQRSPVIQIGSTGFLGVLVPAARASQARSPRVQRQLQLRQDRRTSGFSVQPSTPVCLANDLNAGVPARVAPVTAGALIIGELCGTPADSAGLVAGDVITAVGGRPVTSPQQLTSVMRGLRPGMSVEVTWVDVAGLRHRSELVLIQAPPR